MTKICSWCGKEFEPARGNQKYCSPECTRLAHRKQNREYMKKKRDATPVYKRCKQCGELFKVEKHNYTYCSKECMKEHYRRQKAEYRRTHRKSLNKTRLKWAHAHPDRVKESQKKYYDSMNLSVDYVPPECRKKGQTSCLTCTLPQEECHG